MAIIIYDTLYLLFTFTNYIYCIIIHVVTKVYIVHVHVLRFKMIDRINKQRETIDNEELQILTIHFTVYYFIYHVLLPGLYYKISMYSEHLIKDTSLQGTLFLSHFDTSIC